MSRQTSDLVHHVVGHAFTARSYVLMPEFSAVRSAESKSIPYSIVDLPPE